MFRHWWLPAGTLAFLEASRPLPLLVCLSFLWLLPTPFLVCFLACPLSSFHFPPPTSWTISSHLLFGLQLPPSPFMLSLALASGTFAYLLNPIQSKIMSILLPKITQIYSFFSVLLPLPRLFLISYLATGLSIFSFDSMKYILHNNKT